MAKAKKIDKEYLISDDTVNVYGFRLLTGGYQLAEYQKNPIGYLMHKRTDGVVLRWEDLRIDGDKVYGKPVINLSHPKGQQVVDEIENGFLNAASVGHIVVLEFSDAPDLMLDGQTGPTVTKWYNKEISLVDIPGNPNALIQLYDKDEKEINLADFSVKNLSIPSLNNDTNKQTMDIKKSVLGALNLSDNTDDAALVAKINDLVATAAKVDGLTTSNTTLKKELSDLKAATTEKEVKDLLATALGEKKITKELSDTLAEDYKGNPDGLKKVIGGLSAYVSLADQLGKNEGEVPDKFKGKTYMDLFDADLLEEVKTGFPNLFAQLKKEHEAKKK